MSVILLRIVCVGYCVLLSWLLVAKDPTVLVTPGGLLHGLLTCVGWASHFISFLMLTLLVLAARWRLPGWALLTCLVAYALGMEGLQSLVPTRSVQLQDVSQNLVGIAVGWAIWRGRKAALSRRKSRARSADLPAVDAADRETGVGYNKIS